MPLMGRLLTSFQYLSIRSRPLEKLGKASYHIFLVQMVYYRFLSGTVSKILNVRAAALVAGCAICLAGGYLFYLSEGRFTAYIKTQIRKCTYNNHIINGGINDVK